ncbi:MAG: hypothetical protein N3A60_08250, partial [Thermanaerothrix sp.]|nr:hypothetical protein [Thermanaerothrix sp.]
TYQRKIDTLRDRIERQKIEIKRKEDEYSQRRLEEIGTGGELLMSLFGGRKRSVSSSLTKRRLTAQAKAALDQEKKELETLEKQLATLEQDYNKSLAELQERWAKVVSQETQIPLPPQRNTIFVELFGIAWCPYYLLTLEGKTKTIPAFVN